MSNGGNLTLSGRRAVGTGAGRGIGRSIALALAEAGADVVDAAQVDGQHAVPEVIGMGQKLVTASVASVVDQDI